MLFFCTGAYADYIRCVGKLTKLDIKTFELSFTRLYKKNIRMKLLKITFNSFQKHSEELTNARNDFENKAKELESKYEKKYTELRNHLNTKHQ